MHRNILALASCAALLLAGCSSRPRDFAPTLSAQATDQQAFDFAYATCQQLYVAGKLDHNGRASSLGGGAAAGATTAAVGAGTAAAIGGYGGLAAASATVVLLPFAIVGGAWGMARAKRAKKERTVKLALEGCLQERGHSVAGWERVQNKRAAATATAAN